MLNIVCLSYICCSWQWETCCLGSKPIWSRRGLKCSWRMIMCEFWTMMTIIIIISSSFLKTTGHTFRLEFFYFLLGDDWFNVQETWCSCPNKWLWLGTKWSAWYIVRRKRCDSFHFNAAWWVKETYCRYCHRWGANSQESWSQLFTFQVLIVTCIVYEHLSEDLIDHFYLPTIVNLACTMLGTNTLYAHSFYYIMVIKL